MGKKDHTEKLAKLKKTIERLQGDERAWEETDCVLDEIGDALGDSSMPTIEIFSTISMLIDGQVEKTSDPTYTLSKSYALEVLSDDALVAELKEIMVDEGLTDPSDRDPSSVQSMLERLVGDAAYEQATADLDLVADRFRSGILESFSDAARVETLSRDERACVGSVDEILSDIPSSPDGPTLGCKRDGAR